jgi:hypothetical protein
MNSTTYEVCYVCYQHYRCASGYTFFPNSMIIVVRCSRLLYVVTTHRKGVMYLHTVQSVNLSCCTYVYEESTTVKIKFILLKPRG